MHDVPTKHVANTLTSKLCQRQPGQQPPLGSRQEILRLHTRPCGFLGFFGFVPIRHRLCKPPCQGVTLWTPKGGGLDWRLQNWGWREKGDANLKPINISNKEGKKQKRNCKKNLTQKKMMQKNHVFEVCQAVDYRFVFACLHFGPFKHCLVLLQWAVRFLELSYPPRS